MLYCIRLNKPNHFCQIQFAYNDRNEILLNWMTLDASELGFKYHKQYHNFSMGDIYL